MFLTQSGGFIIKPISRLLGAILSLLSRVECNRRRINRYCDYSFYADRTFDHIPVDV